MDTILPCGRERQGKVKQGEGVSGDRGCEMDTSEQYVKMCDEEEIQGIWNHEQHFLDRPHSYIVDNGRSGWTWLPRQDQLQEMVSERLKKIRIGIDWYFGDQWRMIYYDDPLKHYVIHGGTFEQLWLAFVMKEKFNKIWDGSKWE